MTSPLRGSKFFLPWLKKVPSTASSSRRVQQRSRLSGLSVDVANRCVTSINHLYNHHAPLHNNRNNQYSLPSSSHSFPAFFPASAQRGAQHILSCSRRFVSRLGPVGPSRGDTASPSGDSSDFPDIFSFAASLDYASPPPAVPLVASAIALPAEAGTCNLLDVLPPALAARYAVEDPSLFRPPSEQLPARAAVMVRSSTDYVDIVRRLHSLSMVSFTTNPKIVNGLFGTPKADGLLRFLFDGRPANAAFVPSPHVSLPSPELLGRLNWKSPRGKNFSWGRATSTISTTGSAFPAGCGSISPTPPSGLPISGSRDSLATF